MSTSLPAGRSPNERLVPAQVPRPSRKKSGETSVSPSLGRALESIRVADEVRALARRVGPIKLDVHLVPGSLPPGLAQLIKLALLEPASLSLRFAATAGDAWVLARRDGAETRLEEACLRGRLIDLLVPMLTALMTPEQMIRQSLNLLQENHELARQDHLTGLWNRRELEARLSQERARAQRGGTLLALLLLGLDDLPERHREGEPGDSILRVAGALLRQELRAVDVVARFEERELAVVLPGAGVIEAANVARRLGVAALNRDLSFSIGVAAYPEDVEHPDDLVGLASRHLAAAREGGKARASLSVDGEPIVFAEE